MEALRHAYRRDISRLNREIEIATEHLDDVADTYEESKLARAELQSQDGTVGILPAVPPRQPLPRRLLLRLVIAVVLGLCLGLVVAGVRELLGGGGGRTGRYGGSVFPSDAA
jgi:uncharacterized protein involved in exopolysaccharide biosynthesis